MKARLTTKPENKTLNRSIRRMWKHQYGIDPKIIERILNEKQDHTDSIKSGDAVKLNYDRIISQSDLSELYTKWIEDNKDRVFTVYQDEEHKGSNLFSFVEDDNKTPWIFDASDLIKVEQLTSSDQIDNN